MQWCRLWRSDIVSATNAVHRISINKTFHYHIHNSSPLFLLLSQMNPVYVSSFCFLKMYFKMTLPLMVDLPSGHFPLEFPDYIFAHICIFLFPLKCANNITIIKLFITHFSPNFVLNSSSWFCTFWACGAIKKYEIILQVFHRGIFVGSRGSITTVLTIALYKT
jgi:hypothetical protein